MDKKKVEKEANIKIHTHQHAFGATKKVAKTERE